MNDCESGIDLGVSALLAGGVAHEMNTLLTSFAGTLQLVRDSLPAGALVFELAAAERMVERAAAISHTLLSIERGDRGERESVSLQRSVEDVLAVLESRLHKRRIDVHRHFQSIPDVAVSRCGALRVVLAMVAAAERSVRGRPGRIDIATGANESEAWLSITDNGEGGEAPGIEVDHGGRLEVSGEAGVSATRTLYLPLYRLATTLEDPNRIGNGLRVLVVDDEKAIRKMLTVLLESRAFEVRTAEGCGPARERLSRDEFDVVLLDLVMPGVQGVDLLDELRRERPQLPVIVISGESVEPSVEELRRRGAVGVMRKPLRLELLARMCRAAARGETLPDA
jgi:CheY-like chemotaxis protein